MLKIMPKGFYIGTALRTVDPNMWWGWSGLLKGTESDVKLTESKLKMFGYESNTLLTKDCTVENLISLHKEVANKAMDGDIVVWWHSGHGVAGLFDGGTGENNGDKNNDLRDEGIVLYDLIFTDNMIEKTLAMYKKGVRIFVGFDTCHSGQMYRFAPMYMNAFVEEYGNDIAFKYLPEEIELKAKANYANAYDFQHIHSLLPKSKTWDADVKIIGACQANQYAADLGFNGLFTARFWECYEQNKNLPYVELFRRMLPNFPPNQTPTYYTKRGNSRKFNTEPIFTI